MAAKAQQHPDQALLDELQSLIYSARSTSISLDIPTFCDTGCERTDKLTISWEGAPDFRFALRKMIEVYSR